MAKNLKINVKNTQLAEVLKLGKVSKPAVKKKKPEEAAAGMETPKVAASAAPLVEKPLPEVPAPTPRPEEKGEAVQPPLPSPVTSPEELAAPEVRTPAPKEESPAPARPAQPPRAPMGQGTPHWQRPPARPPGSYAGGQPPVQHGPRPAPGAGAQRSTFGPSPRYPGPGGPSGYRPGYAGPGRPAPSHGPGGYRPSAGAAGQQPGYRPGGGAPQRFGGPPSPGVRAPYPRREPFTPRPFTPGAPGGYRPETRRPITQGPHAEPPRGEEKTERKGKTFEEERKAPPKEFREHKPAKKVEEYRSFDARDRQGLRADQEEQRWRKRRPIQKMRPAQQEEVIRPRTLSIRIPVTVKDLAAAMKLKSSQLIAKLFMKGVIMTLNDFLDDEATIQLLGHDFDCEITIDRTEEDRLRITDKTIRQEIQETPPESLTLRPPVAAFMGHVDHGKTSLIDAIRKSNLASGEAGAITQHIGAFKCHTATGDLTILDTPGHEAFSAMRARGADVTDIVVLVIAGDEGIRAQTVEAIEQAAAANVPVLVALNKCDKPNFDADKVYHQLAERNLLPEAWGGSTITVNCSAVSGVGIKELLEMLALQAEVLELRSNPTTRARGTVIESEMHKGLGAVATVLVQNGTLRLGDSLVFAQQFARVKTMHDEHGRELKEAGPSTPVKITGLSDLPPAGSEFIVVKNEKEAMLIAEKRSEGQRHALLHKAKRGAESFLAEKANNIRKKVLNLILRADVQGSVEALKTSLMKITSDKIELNIISSSVGEISESDVQLASASKATIIGFHTQIESHADSLIKALKITVKLHDIIYHAVDDVRAIMRGMLDKIAKENDVGTAEVKATFKASQLGVIAGCMVTDGSIKRSNHVRLIRDNQVIWKGPIQSLKKVKEDVREVSKGHECGIVLQNNNDVKIGDILQAFEITWLEQEL